MHSILTTYQVTFISEFVERTEKISLLCANAGTGKTTASFFTMQSMREHKKCDKAIMVTDRIDLTNSFVESRTGLNIKLTSDLKELIRDDISTGLFSLAALEKLGQNEVEELYKFSETKRIFFVIEEAHRLRNTNVSDEIIHKVLFKNKDSRALLLSNHGKTLFTNTSSLIVDKEYYFDVDFSFFKKENSSIIQWSPSLSILDKILRRNTRIEDLNWREFEKLISQLLEKEGYEIKLTRGTKDGGVDVIAVKDIDVSGYFKTIWQAKKKEKGKVGLSLIRELADVAREEKASKGIIVTSTFLTRGALKRVERDNHYLGKVDRKDLNDWIAKYF